MSELVMNRRVEFVERPPFPRNILVELTNICNHACAFCGYKKMNRRKVFCDLEFTKDIIKQAFENGTREIGFYLIGEPLLSKDLEACVEYAKKIGFEYIYLTTNGALADVERVKQLVNLGLNSIKFSINGASSETYEKVHGKKDFDIVRENVRKIHEWIVADDINLKMFVSFIKNNWNKDEEPLIHDIFDGLVDKVYVFHVANQGGDMLELVDLGMVDSVEDIPRTSVPCEMVFNRLHITAEGYLDACCADCNGMLALVDLHHKSLKEAWEDERFMELRRQHMTGTIKKGVLCYNCANNVKEEVYPLTQLGFPK